jgi:hypothetical protein
MLKQLDLQALSNDYLAALATAIAAEVNKRAKEPTDPACIILQLRKVSNLQWRITDLMDHWHPCDNAADYRCEFCGTTAQTNEHSVVHPDDCEGKLLLNVINAVLAAESV